METVELLLEDVVRIISLALEFTAIVCVIIGFISAILLMFKPNKIESSPLHNRLRLTLGGWLALALEFQLASDIIKTTVAPTYENLIQLGAIAIIRTFLNYFLSKELVELPELINKHLKEELNNGKTV